jgi:hypothetical protein
MIETSVGPFQLEKHTPSKWVYQKYETYNTNMEPHNPIPYKSKWGIILHKEKAYTTKGYW